MTHSKSSANISFSLFCIRATAGGLRKRSPLAFSGQALLCLVAPRAPPACLAGMTARCSYFQGMEKPFLRFPLFFSRWLPLLRGAVVAVAALTCAI